MENFLGWFFKGKQGKNKADAAPIIDPAPVESGRSVLTSEKRMEIVRLALVLEQAGYDPNALESAFDKNIIGTADATVFRYIQLKSELAFGIPVAMIAMSEGFSDKAAVQSIIEQVTKDTTPVPNEYYAYLGDRIENPYTIAISIALGLQPTDAINAFANMFRSYSTTGRIKGVVLSQNREDIPPEIRRNIGHIPIPTPKT